MNASRFVKSWIGGEMEGIRKTIGSIDRSLFGGALKRWYVDARSRGPHLRHKADVFDYGVLGQYSKNNNSQLNSLCDKFGSDKGEVTSGGNPYPWPSHNYADMYELMFRLRRNDVALVVECGIGTNNPSVRSSMGVDGKPGASLRVWREYFPNARIIGIDIDSDILFHEERIETYQCDQTSAKSVAAFCRSASLTGKSVDIIIDDGLHEYHAGKALFESMSEYLADDGIYVIEDVGTADYVRYKDYFAERMGDFTVQFYSLQRPNLVVGGNRMIVIRHAV